MSVATNTGLSVQLSGVVLDSKFVQFPPLPSEVKDKDLTMA